jgi:hypothetical protein
MLVPTQRTGTQFFSTWDADMREPARRSESARLMRGVAAEFFGTAAGVSGD